MREMIFVTGFARGGTSWLRDCIASHPAVTRVPNEVVLFDGRPWTRESLITAVRDALREQEVSGDRLVTKAPANARDIYTACKLLPASRFIFIIRDPRDVFTSHKRGKQEWMGGANSTVDGCMKKTRQYYEGYLRAKDLPNITLVRYEDLHQNFDETMARLFDFLQLPADAEFMQRVFQQNHFVSSTGRRHKEDRNAARRKGVVGDWANHLTSREIGWFKRNPYWSAFLRQHGYSSTPLTYQSILAAMREANVHALNELELFEAQLFPDRVSIALMHDIDLLGTNVSRKSILNTARIERRLGFSALYNFLPLDDVRYRKHPPKKTIALMRAIRRKNPGAYFGLHLNATERYFPIDAPEAGDDHPDVAKALAYMHESVDAYEKAGVRFRIATAHGYGRARRKPNNRDTLILGEQLEQRGIRLFDNTIRQHYYENAANYVGFTDVGGSLAIYGMPQAGRLDDADTYRQLAPGTFMCYLTHPGNYPVDDAIVLAMRDTQWKPSPV